MSGIFGLLRFDQAEVSPRDLDAMARRLAHLAPDGFRTVRRGGLGLGHGLMRVTQEDLHDAQPIQDDVFLLSADLRLDNRAALAAALGIEPCILAGMPDSALLLEAWRLWGPETPVRLLGDFAFALWDGTRRRLYLVRDHMGQRPLHYYVCQDFIAFATEIKGLWCLPDVPRQFSRIAFGRSFVYELDARDGETIFEGIKGVPGGATLAVSLDGGTELSRYWEPKAGADHLGHDEAYYVRTYRNLLQEVVNSRIARLIEPPALCLSAGYDSAAIAGMAGPALNAKSMKMIALSWVLGADAKLRSPRRWVDACRRHMPHLDVRLLLRQDRTLFTGFERTAISSDQVPHLGQEITDALYGEAARAGARMVMDGIGGDETLNPRGGDALARWLRQGRFWCFLRELAAHLVRGNATPWRTMKDLVLRLMPLAARRRRMLRKRGGAPFGSDWLLARDFARALEHDGQIDVEKLPQNFILGDRQALRRPLIAWLAQTPRGHFVNEAAAHGLILTRPMLDKRLVEFGLAVPPDLHVRAGRNRYLARTALADVYPPEFQRRSNRPDLFEPDMAGAFRLALPQLEAEAERRNADEVTRSLIDMDRVTALIAKGKAGRATLEEITLAMRALQAARYEAWFTGRNG